jgi:signal peptidase I
MPETTTTTDAETEKEEKHKKSIPPRDPAREVVETIVFVVVLVLLLKLFVTEAFVIPTGSMAETLYGYQKIITCPKCKHEFPVNSHDEVEGRQGDGKQMKLYGFCCPNCRYLGHILRVQGLDPQTRKLILEPEPELQPPPKNSSGDRVLVLKPLYHIREPRRGDVVVFKFPEKPQDKFTAQNYIKRAQAFGGETAAIFRGDLYITTYLSYDDDESREWVRLTTQSLDGLRSENLPEAVLDRVEKLKNRELKRDDLEKEVAEQLNAGERTKFLTQIVNHAEKIYPRPANPLDLWKPRFMYTNAYPLDNPNPKALELFEHSRATGFKPGEAGFGTAGFEIVRKGEEQLLADARIVWDNDQQPEEFATWKVPSRWYATGSDAQAWTADQADQPRVFGHKGEVAGTHWIHYRHLSMPWKTLPADDADPEPPTDPARLREQKPTYVDNFLGYNAGRDFDPGTQRVQSHDNPKFTERWVGDLILQCKVVFTAGSEVTLELSKSINRFRATFSEGKVTLSRIGHGSEKFGNPSRPCKVKEGTHELRFANVDCRLWVWVDGKRIDFGTEGDYQPIEPGPGDGADPEGWTKANDIDAPAGIGATGKVTIQNIKLQRDIYYTRDSSGQLDHSKADVFYVHKGHYLCLGDNSAQSSDSRKWGTVPERLMLGKAVFVFFPVNRVGFIK